MSTLAKGFSRRSGPHTSGSVAQTDLSALVLRLRFVSDACLFVVIFAVPMTSACLQEAGILLFACCSLLMGVAWAVEQILEPSEGSGATGAEFIVLAAVGLVCFQLVPVSTSLLKSLAPFSAEYLTLWGTAEGRILGETPWQTISLTPSLTHSGLLLLIAYAIFFFTLMQKLRTVQDIDRLIRHVAIAATAMGILGIAQLFFGNGQFLWLFEHPFRTAAWPAKGAFSNQNHFAHFLALGLGPLLWCWRDATPQQEGTVIRGSVQTAGFGTRRSQESQRQMFAAAIGVVLLAGTLSFSRGGIAAVIVALLLSVRIVWQQWKHLLKFALPIGSFVVIAVWMFGTEYLEHKIARIQNAGSIQELLAGRFALWNAISDAVPSFWFAGSGLGSHAEIYPTWLEQNFGVRFSHAESGYLQILLELGVVGISLLAAALALITSWIVRAWKHGDPSGRDRVTVLSAGIVVSVLHSFVDFVWYIPGCMILTLVLVACVARCCQLHTAAADNTQARTGGAAKYWPPVLAWLILLIAMPFGRASADVLVRDAETEDDWSRYRKHAIAARDASDYKSQDSLDDRLDSIILHLEECVTRDPSDYRAASDLSAMYLRRFERHQIYADNRVNIREIRSTVRSVGFESAQEIAAWLKRAFGENAADLYRALTMARRAVRGQPTRGETYLVLAQVGFLAGISEQEEEALIDQARKLRPHKAGVLYFVGLAHAEAGDLENALVEWKTAFDRDSAIRPLIVDNLAPYLSAEDLIARLEPQADSLWLIFAAYRKQQKQEDVKFITDWFGSQFEQLSTHPDRGRFFWQRSYEMFSFSGDNARALECLNEAVRVSPSNYELRKTLGLALLDDQRPHEALPHLKWCQVRDPEDAQIEEALIHLNSNDHEVNRAE